ncbi:MAG TPA: DUF4339 domain-containing protein [Pyrinomonadaceae bacterium]
MEVYVYRNNRQEGPYEEAAVAEGLRSGSLSPDDLARFVGSDRWAPLGSLFPHLLRAPQPPPLPPPAHTWMDDSATGRPARPVEPLRPGAHPYAPPVQYVPPPVPVPPPHTLAAQQQAARPYGGAKPGGLPAGAMSMSVVALCLMLVGLIPCLGWLNWLTILIGVIAHLLSWVAVFTEKNEDARSKAVIGLVVSFVAVFIGGIRLVLGFGCL